MKIYETSSVLFNILNKRFSKNYIINYNDISDTITVETSDVFSYGTKLSFELHKEGITCLKEYIYILCQNIIKIKEDTESLKNDTNSLKDYKNEKDSDIQKIPNISEEIENLKKEIDH